MENEEVQMNVLILRQVRTDAKIEAKNRRITLNRFVENAVKKELKANKLIDKS